VRVIAATNRDLEKEVAAGRFRSDLFFRLNVFPVVMPPLRDRAGDLELLVPFFVDRFARELGRRIESVSRSSWERLLAYDWPGNIRELSNLIERAVVLARGPSLELGAELLPVGSGAAPVARAARREPEAEPPRTLDTIQRQHIIDTLTRTDWVIEGPDGAAVFLGLQPSTLRSRMKKLGVRRPTASR
jgi:formate hydrogenlyase transcriptional activator